MQKKPVPISKSTPAPKRQPKPGRNALGQWVKGVCGCPSAKVKPGHKWRFPPGVSGNPAGVAKKHAEHNRLIEAIKEGADDPALAQQFWSNLRDGLKAKEAWATCWYGDNLVKPLLPKLLGMPGFTLQAGINLEVNGDEGALDAFLGRIAGIAARHATEGTVEDAAARAIECTPVQVDLLGAPQPA